MKRSNSLVNNSWVSLEEKLSYLINQGKLKFIPEEEILLCCSTFSSLNDLYDHCKYDPIECTPVRNEEGLWCCPLYFRNYKNHLQKIISHVIEAKSEELKMEKEIFNHYMQAAKTAYTQVKDNMKKSAKLPWFKKDFSSKKVQPKKRSIEPINTFSSNLRNNTTQNVSDLKWDPPSYLSSISSFLPDSRESFGNKPTVEIERNFKVPKETQLKNRDNQFSSFLKSSIENPDLNGKSPTFYTPREPLTLPSIQNIITIPKIDPLERDSIQVSNNINVEEAIVLNSEELKIITIEQASQISLLKSFNEKLMNEKRKLEEEKDNLELELRRIKQKLRIDKTTVDSSNSSPLSIDSDSN